SFDVTGWNALFVPAGTPEPIVHRLNGALVGALHDEGVKKRVREIGATVPSGEQLSPAWLDAFVRDEIVKWRDVVKNSDAATNRLINRSGLSAKSLRGGVMRAGDRLELD